MRECHEPSLTRDYENPPIPPLPEEDLLLFPTFPHTGGFAEAKVKRDRGINHQGEAQAHGDSTGWISVQLMPFLLEARKKKGAISRPFSQNRP